MDGPPTQIKTQSVSIRFQTPVHQLKLNDGHIYDAIGSLHKKNLWWKNIKFNKFPRERKRVKRFQMKFNWARKRRWKIPDKRKERNQKGTGLYYSRYARRYTSIPMSRTVVVSQPTFKTCQDDLFWCFWHFQQERNKWPSWSGFGVELFISPYPYRRRRRRCCWVLLIATVFLSVIRATKQAQGLSLVRHLYRKGTRGGPDLVVRSSCIPPTHLCPIQNKKQQQQQQ